MKKSIKKVKKKFGNVKKPPYLCSRNQKQTSLTIKLQNNMFKTRKIQHRANEIFAQMKKENTIITIIGESYYDSAYRINFYIDGKCYQARITDDSLPVRPGTTEETNSMEIASFAACVIASKEFGRYPEKYIKTYNKCELI